MNIESLSEWFSAIGPEWLSAIGTVAATVAAVGIAAYTFHIGQHNKKYEGLRYVFELLDDNGHRNARRRIINLYRENEEDRIIKILRLMGVKQEDIDRKETIIIESEEIVKADFEEVGSLLINGEIPHDDFIKIYWRDIYKCWEVLENKIKEIQEKTDTSYMKNFEYLKREAIKYATKNLNVQDFRQLVKKDINVHPELKEKDYDPNSRQISFQSDEQLNDDTLNPNNIYLMDENGNQISEPQVDIKYNNSFRLVIVEIPPTPPDKKCYLFFSKNIKDIHGNSLKKDIQTDRTF